MHASVTRWPIALAAVTALALLLLGCRPPQLDALTVHPSFNYQALASGRVAVLPPSSSAKELSAAELRALQNRVAEIVATKRKGVAVLLAPTTGDNPQVAHLVEAFQHSSKIDAAESRALGKRLGARFLVVAHFDRYDTEQSEEVITETTGEGDDAEEVTRHRYETRARLRGQLAIVEAELAEIWWHGLHTTVDASVNSYDDDPDDTVVGDILHAVFVGRSHPDPPPASGLAEQLLKAMVANWPNLED
jgi:hypothetical protein